MDKAGELVLVYTDSSSILYVRKYNSANGQVYFNNLGSGIQLSNAEVDTAGELILAYTDTSSNLYIRKDNSRGINLLQEFTSRI